MNESKAAKGIAIWVWALLPVLGWAEVTSAQVVQGADYQVNTNTLDDQYLPDVAVTEDGRFLVVWQSDSSAGDDVSNTSIQGRFFGLDGNPAGGDFQVNTYTSGAQRKPAVAADPAGGFVVVWEQSGAYPKIMGQRISADGLALGGEFQVDSVDDYTYISRLADPDVAYSGPGDFMVVWSYFEDTGGGQGVLFRRIHGRSYDPGGAVTPGLLFEATSCDLISLDCDAVKTPVIAGNSAGELLVSWNRENFDLGGNDFDAIVTRRFSATGQPQAAEQLVVNLDGIDVANPAIAHRDDRFLLVWESGDVGGMDGSGFGIRGRQLADDGTPVGVELEINSTTTGDQLLPAVAAEPSSPGAFLVAWQDDGVLPALVRGQRMAADGGPVGAELGIAQSMPGDQQRPALAAGIAVWDSAGSGGDDSSGISIQARRVTAFPIFADGFESGDVSAWSASVP